jgi:hypothetical protein
VGYGIGSKSLMKNIIFESIRLGRFQSLLVIIFLAILVGLFFRYFTMARANLERFTFEQTLQKIKKTVTAIDLGYPVIINDKCQALKKEIFFPQLGKKQQWDFDAENFIVTFTPTSSTYFNSPQASIISIHILCENNKISIIVSPYTWCGKMSIVGCEHWDKQ